jgi:hypothetical protein
MKHRRWNLNMASTLAPSTKIDALTAELIDQVSGGTSTLASTIRALGEALASAARKG